MNKTGLCSITFRELSPLEIIKLVQEAKLDAIEWGSDIHVKPDDEKNAHEIRKMMDEHKLITSSYGSYYRVGIENEFDFEQHTNIASILGAKEIRVWAGRKGSLDADEAYRNNVIKDAQRIADIANEKAIGISLEYHAKTLTDTSESALKLLKEIDRDNVNIYWQPSIDTPIQTRIKNIQTLKDYITNIHVFSWDVIERLNLETKEQEWLQYLETIDKEAPQKERYFLLEFVKDDSIEQFKKDAQTLNRWINRYKV